MESFVHLRKGTTPRRLHADLGGLKDDELGRGGFTGRTANTKPPVLGAGFGQLRSLLDIARSFAARLPMLLLLHRQIPHIPPIAAMRQQRRLLIRGRQQPKPRHSDKVSTTTGIPDAAPQPHAGDRLPPPPHSRGYQPKEIQ